MGLMHLICWTSDHFIKKHWNVRRETRFSRVRIFRNFAKISILDFWPLYPIQFFARIFIVATRIFFDEANDVLWPNYTFLKFFDHCFFSIFWFAKNLGKYNTIGPKTQIYRGFLGRRHQAGGLFQSFDLAVARVFVFVGIRELWKLVIGLRALVLNRTPKDTTWH